MGKEKRERKVRATLKQHASPTIAGAAAVASAVAAAGAAPFTAPPS